MAAAVARARPGPRAVSAEVAGSPEARVWRQPGRGRGDPDCRVPSLGAVTQATLSDCRDPRGERVGAAHGPHAPAQVLLRMSPAALRNGDPCRRPGLLSRYPFWLYDLHLATTPHCIAQSGRPGSGVRVAWEGAGPRPWRGRPHRMWSPCLSVLSTPVCGR